MVVDNIAKEFKNALEDLYGDELADLILFGSYARGDFRKDSDIDFAVVLNNPATTSTSEISKISTIGTDLSMKYNCFISYIGIPKHKLENSDLGIYQEIRRDGKRI
ncbi:MAG: nucleotidyltransferase domain-containing protein [Spirosomaceae bacterium]|nr:nucleotidyltransferase domain-containing protein [Spirosomataceae bacterium]